MTLQEQLAAGTPGIIAILRGVHPDEVVAVGNALVDAGIRIIEVPLNSPQPLLSIKRLAASLPADVLVGAGTVTSASAVDEVAATGARLIVAPNANADVIARSIALHLEVAPGVMTPSEAFAAVAAGARHLKLFPAASSGTAHLKALREVLPSECCMWAVGGTNAGNLAEWLAAGAVGIGVGGALFSAGASLKQVQARAAELVKAWQAAKANT
jgi:2-dehydro-3-deoxyphosphogalactonate aldolase